MLRLAVDENFNNDIVRALRRRNPEVDLVRVQDAGLSGADDRTVLKWAATQRRVLLTHDVNTVTAHAYRLIEEGRSMEGVFAVPQSLAIGRAVEDLLLIVECSRTGEWAGQVRYLPL